MWYSMPNGIRIPGLLTIREKWIDFSLVFPCMFAFPWAFFLVKPFPYTTQLCPKLTSNMSKSKTFRMHDTDLCGTLCQHPLIMIFINKDPFIIKENYALFNIGKKTILLHNKPEGLQHSAFFKSITNFFFQSFVTRFLII